MSDFEQRLQKAIDRGENRRDSREAEARQRAMSDDDLKTLHTKYRLELSEHIEKSIQQLPDHFPGFRFETIFGEKGWGAACSRDDLDASSGRKRANAYSRVELTVRPFSNLFVLELVGKATISNKEAFNRTVFEELEKADPQRFHELIDTWVVEYAELYAAKR
jgi:hypothetical protein